MNNNGDGEAEDQLVAGSLTGLLERIGSYFGTTASMATTVVHDSMALTLLTVRGPTALQVLSTQEPDGSWAVLRIRPAPGVCRYGQRSVQTSLIPSDSVAATLGMDYELRNLATVLLDGKTYVAEWDIPISEETCRPRVGLFGSVAQALELNDDSTAQRLVESLGQRKSVDFIAELALRIYTDRDPLRALSIIRQMVAANESEDVLRRISAGPLEQLIIQNGEQILSELRAVASTDDRFRWCISRAWIEQAPPTVRSGLADLMQEPDAAS